MYIKRDLGGVIEKYLSKPEIIAVIGPRQAGKTTLIKNVIGNLTNVKQITFDDVAALALFEKDIESFIDINVKPYDYLFIDEVQYAKESGKKLKYIFDTQKVKLIISGSSSADISIQSLQYLVGRILIFTLSPFSFKEYLSAKAPTYLGVYEKRVYGNEIRRQFNVLLNEFLLFGGYPQVVLADDVEEKKRYLQNIFNTLLLRDVKDLFGMADTDKLFFLLKALALQIGNLINYTELCNMTGYKLDTLKKYIKILEDLYICKRCSSFSKNPRTELVKTPKIYFYDYGLRNIIINNFTENRTDLGAMYENLVYGEFLKKEKELKYWRTKSGAEVDFILNEEPIEIKSIPKTSRSLYSFIKKYQPKNGYVISTEEKESIEKDGCKINFVPFSKFI